jgi:hypothetical protein
MNLHSYDIVHHNTTCHNTFMVANLFIAFMICYWTMLLSKDYIVTWVYNI